MLTKGFLQPLDRLREIQFFGLACFYTKNLLNGECCKYAKVLHSNIAI